MRSEVAMHIGSPLGYKTFKFKWRAQLLKQITSDVRQQVEEAPGEALCYDIIALFHSFKLKKKKINTTLLKQCHI